jgi:hypothetical protein
MPQAAAEKIFRDFADRRGCNKTRGVIRFAVSQLESGDRREEARMDRDMEIRIARLEKSARRWKLAAIVSATLLTTGVLMAQIRIGGGAGGGINAPALTCDKVTTKNLLLNDANGAERGSLTVDTNDNAILSLKDSKGVATVEVRTDADGLAAVRILTAKGKTLAILSSDAKEQPAFLLKDAEGKKLFSAP